MTSRSIHHAHSIQIVVATSLPAIRDATQVEASTILTEGASYMMRVRPTRTRFLEAPHLSTFYTAQGYPDDGCDRLCVPALYT